ncbi:MAG: pirin-like C-terminal cupin domain-containing protein [Ferruginibacter sp.]|nr:pirin-like C-terminal cupin domain-containing protein [Ferruginibacter sp.]
MINRKIRSIQQPPSTRGFLGKGHIAVPVINGMSFVDTDPFILLMDDQLDLPGEGVVGGPHPHAGFETVTLVLEGDEFSDEKTLQTGGLEWMTAGSGIVHTEEIRHRVKMRILQLWLVLPKLKRRMEPRWQELHLNNVPVKRDGKNEIRVYSGTSMGMTAPTMNETPTILVDFTLEPGHEVIQELQGHFNAFLYVLDGSVETGEEKNLVHKGEVAWLEKTNEHGASQIILRGGENGTRFVFYAGEPQGVEIINHGPFISDTPEDIARLYQEYRQGKMKHVRDLPGNRVLKHT